MSQIIEVIERYEIPDVPTIELPTEDCVPLVADSEGHMWSSVLNGWVGLWRGTYQRVEGIWLRAFTERDGCSQPKAKQNANTQKLPRQKSHGYRRN